MKTYNLKNKSITEQEMYDFYLENNHKGPLLNKTNLKSWDNYYKLFYEVKKNRMNLYYVIFVNCFYFFY